MGFSWQGAAQGVNEGFQNAERLQRMGQAAKQEERSEIDWHFQNDPIATPRQLLESIGDEVSPEYREKMLTRVKSNYGFDPDTPISRKHINMLSPVIGQDESLKNLADQGRLKFVTDQMGSIEDKNSEQYKILQAKKTALEYKVNPQKMEEEKLKVQQGQVAASMKHAEAAMKNAETSAAQAEKAIKWKDMEEQIVNSGFPIEKQMKLLKDMNDAKKSGDISASRFMYQMERDAERDRRQDEKEAKADIEKKSEKEIAKRDRIRENTKAALNAIINKADIEGTEEEIYKKKSALIALQRLSDIDRADNPDKFASDLLSWAGAGSKKAQEPYKGSTYAPQKEITAPAQTRTSAPGGPKPFINKQTGAVIYFNGKNWVDSKTGKVVK